jgi:hypothetical protein
MFASEGVSNEIPYRANSPQLTAPRAVQSNMVYLPQMMTSPLTGLGVEADKR